MLRHSSGQARVILSGKVHYLGVFGSPEVHARYGQLVREWEKNGRQSMQPALNVVEASYRVRDLFADYKCYLDESGRYTKDGQATSQRKLIDVALGYRLALTDIDADGDSDLVTANAAGHSTRPLQWRWATWTWTATSTLSAATQARTGSI